MGYDELPHFPTPLETFSSVPQPPPSYRHGPPPPQQHKQQMYTGYNNPRGGNDDLPHFPTPGETFSDAPPPHQHHPQPQYGRPPPSQGRHQAPRKPSGGNQGYNNGYNNNSNNYNQGPGGPGGPQGGPGGYNNNNNNNNNNFPPPPPPQGQPLRPSPRAHNQQLQQPPPMHQPGGPSGQNRPPPSRHNNNGNNNSNSGGTKPGTQSPIPYAPLPDVNLKMLFNGVDKNNNGRLSEKELGNALVNGDFTKFNIETVRVMIKMFDRSGNGTIEFKEFCNLWRYLGDWRKLFDKFDLDKSGSISYDEYVRALEAFGYRLSNKFIQFMYSTYSSFNGAGERVIGFDLFVQSCISLKRMTDSFVQYDTDHTGYVNLSFEQFLMEIMKLK
ncbi:Programmed cell death protein 6 [Yarrowia sp. B02]|nr:Programmed cell death protein 6 [Yarrowia sp. B02]